MSVADALPLPSLPIYARWPVDRARDLSANKQETLCIRQIPTGPEARA
jgi:hypothetical protein